MWPLGYLAVRKASTSSQMGTTSSRLFLLLAAQPQSVGTVTPTSSQLQSARREQRGGTLGPVTSQLSATAPPDTSTSLRTQPVGARATRR